MEKRVLSKGHLNTVQPSISVHFFFALFFREVTFVLSSCIGHWSPFPHPTQSLWLFSFSLSLHHLGGADPDAAEALSHGFEERVAEGVHTDGVDSTDTVDLD